jgi:hypothetical protein
MHPEVTHRRLRRDAGLEDTRARRADRADVDVAYLGAVPPEPPEAGICVGKPKPHGGTGKVDWRSRRML